MKHTLGMKNYNSEAITWTVIIPSCLYALLIVLLVNFHAWAADQRPEPSLTDVVLFASLPLSSLDTAAYRDKQQVCVKKYLMAAKKYMHNEPKPGQSEQNIAIRRWRMERYILLIQGPTSKKDAGLFASGVPLILEWEGMSEGPLVEADYTEQWLKQYPQSPIVPFVHIFAAHRYRAGFETASSEHAKGLIPNTAAKYKQHLQAARSAGNGWITCIADDMEGLAYVYLSGFGRP
jgi:hypothetical protein